MLYLLAHDDPTVVVLAAKLLARLLVVNGRSYMKKFAERTSGIVIMQRQLKRWWSVPSLWPICFAVLFGQDVASIDMDRTFNLYNLLVALNASENTSVINPEIFTIIAGMLQNGLRSVTRDQTDPDSPMEERNDVANARNSEGLQATVIHRRSPSMSLNIDSEHLGEK